jgi:type IX secretion system substrate protein
MKKVKLLALLCSSAFMSFAQINSPAIQWQVSLGGSKNDFAYALERTSDGGYIVAGQTASNDSEVTGNHGVNDYWVVKLSETGSIQWTRCLGGTGDQKARAVQQTTDGGYIIAGTSKDTVNGDITVIDSSYDYWVVKLDDTGAIKWQKSYGGTGNDIATAIIQTSDGGYMVAGSTDSANGDVSLVHGLSDIWVVKLNDTGALQWQKSFGGPGDDHANTIGQTSDGGYILAGYTNSANGDITSNHGANDAWILKLSSAGSIEWQKCYGGSDDDGANSVTHTADGGYIVAGYSSSSDGDLSENIGRSDYWVIKLSSSGDIQWQSSLGGLGNEEAQYAVQTTDGGYITAGWTFSTDGNVIGNRGNGDFWVVKLSPGGVQQWQKCLGGTGTDQAFEIHQTGDGGFIVGGTSNSIDGNVTGNNGNNDFWIVKLGAYSGVKPANNGPAISINPNPTSGAISITGAEKVNISVLNMLGQKMAEASGTDHISIASLPAGTYFVCLLDDGGELLKQDKIVKE